MDVARHRIVSGIPVPYGAVVITGKSLEISNSMSKPGANAVEKTCVVACHMKNFEEEAVMFSDGPLQVPLVIHFVKAQMQVLLGLQVMYKGEETVVGLI